MQELDGDVQKLHFTLEVNGQTRQTGDTRQMLFTVDRIIAAVSRYMTLRMGDLIYTGTPAGVGPVSPGDNLRAARLASETLDTLAGGLGVPALTALQSESDDPMLVRLLGYEIVDEIYGVRLDKGT